MSWRAKRYAWYMNLFLDSFWRAIAYCVHPRVIVLSLLPLDNLIVLLMSYVGTHQIYVDVPLSFVP